MSYQLEMSYDGQDLLEEWEDELYYAEALHRWNQENWDLVEEWEEEWEQWMDVQLEQRAW
jgi:hypothetical protein